MQPLLASSPTSLAEVYERYFVTVRASTRALIEEAFRLRYQVYCIENGFEDPARFPDGMETDPYDSHSLHSLLFHRPSGACAGTVRIILPTRDSGYSLPIGTVCPGPLPFPRETTAEISRFSISKDFRRRQVDGRYPDEEISERGGVRITLDNRLIPSMTVGLMREIVRTSSEQGVTHWCAVMMPSLLRLLARLGIHFTPLGPLVDFHGRRQPCYRHCGDLLEQIRSEQREIWLFLTDGGRVRPGAEWQPPPAAS